MYEYTFVSVPVTYQRGKVALEPYRGVVTEYAAAGWRLLQVFVPVPAAMPTEYELIFERPRG